MADGRVFVTTWADGLARYDGQWTVLTPVNSPLLTRRVRSVFEDGLPVCVSQPIVW